MDIQKKTAPVEKTPETNTNSTIIVEDPRVSESMQLEFIDHIVMVYLNRCRSRARNAQVGMPDYILKGKAQEAAVFLGVQKLHNGFVWFERFQKKVIENDARGIILSDKFESVEIADIINDECENFAQKNGLGAIRINGVVLSIYSTSDKSNDNESQKESNKTRQEKTVPVPVEETPETNTNSSIIVQDPRISESMQLKFIDHIVMVYLHRCRARAKNPKISMPSYVLKGKAQEAAIFLGVDHLYNGTVWFERFQRKIKEYDFRGIVLSTKYESVEIADIINDEFENFSLKNGLRAIRLNGVCLSISSTPSNPNNNEDQNEGNTTSPIISGPEIPNEEITHNTSKIQDIVMEMNKKNISKEEFLRYVLIGFLKRFKTRWPEAEVPSMVLNKKFLEAISILGTELIHKHQWLSAFKFDISKKMAGDMNWIKNTMDRPVPTNVHESLEMSDIIATEWPVFLSEHYKSDDSCDSMEKSISQKNTTDESVECFDSIQTYEEALDCLYLLSNYATDIRDLNGLSLLKQIDSFLRSGDYE